MCPSIATRNPSWESSNILRPMLSLFMLLPLNVISLTMLLSSIWSYSLYLQICASSGPSNTATMYSTIHTSLIHLFSCSTLYKRMLSRPHYPTSCLDITGTVHCLVHKHTDFSCYSRGDNNSHIVLHHVQTSPGITIHPEDTDVHNNAVTSISIRLITAWIQLALSLLLTTWSRSPANFSVLVWTD